MDGKIGTYTRDDQRASDPGHGPVILAGKIKENDGSYPVGLVLTRNGTDLEPLKEVADEVLGTGDGAVKDFSGTLGDGLPVEPGTVSVTDGVETFADDGCGNLTGDAGGSGTIDYRTAAFAASFNAAVADQSDVTGSYITAVEGVLDDLADTAKTGSGLYIAHGTCRQDMLKVGAVAQAAPSAALLMRLQKHGIYPV